MSTESAAVASAAAAALVGEKRDAAGSAKLSIPRVPSEGWFAELGTMWPGQAMTLEIEEVLFHERSKYQELIVFKSKTYGTVLVLDGVIQVTERDECSYQEMITHLPMCSHPEPKNVLVVGGGDGGVLREVLKHKSVESVVLCEIDQMVIDVSKKYLPGLSAGAFDDPRVTVFCGDGMQYMREHTGEFDVIITDSSDPVGPAAALFEQSYFKEMHSALREDGLLCSQGECMWLHIEFIAKMLKSCGTLYPSVDYGYTTIPTYPSGQIGFVLCSKNGSTNFKVPVRGVDTGELRYYTPALHSASFVLPKFADDALRA